ncbi:hypothetical protein [Tellurirhabdus rosea]|uniref:hypothetical protein n=1 Tax=Tellurirhabdus rosea TaxID=2674997 RepID=UPI0022578FA9|nr:hypothetical protein [Tellurirhabdus rosea]
MKIGEKLLKQISKKYPPSDSVELRFGRYDVVLKTDEDGNADLLFIGEKTENGQIRGDRFHRRLLKDAEGKIVKDHWDYKGKVS